jgi:fatty-acyl-CoA synthase
MRGLTMDDYQLTLSGVVDRAQRLKGAREVVWRDPAGDVHRTTYGAVIERAHRLGAALLGLGLEKGDRVATLLWNQPEHLEVYFACAGTGLVVHTLNPRLHPDELAYIVGHAEDRVVVVDETLVGVLESFPRAASVEHVIVVARGKDCGADYRDYEELVASAEPEPWVELDERDAAAMCYTSGTTGRPKGVLYSHRALVLHSMCAALPDALGVSANDVVLPVVPMFHANAWGLPYACAMSGAGLVLPGPKLDAENVLDLLAGERVTMTAGVPTVWMAVLQAIEAEPNRWDLSRLQRLIVGGSAVPESMLRGFDKHGLTIIQAWGMTEMSPLGTICRLPADLEERGSEDEQIAYRARQGVPAALVEIRACDDAGAETPWDDSTMGELEVRGPWVAAAYQGGEGADKFTEDGWFRTGDVVKIDATGCIKICDRSKDLIKSGGEWISSVDLENALMGHEAVAEAAVIAVPDDRWGERPLACVVVHEGRDVSAEELREHLAGRFARWQLPERVEFISEIPRTATGKFRKTALREQFVESKSTVDA